MIELQYNWYGDYIELSDRAAIPDGIDLLSENYLLAVAKLREKGLLPVGKPTVINKMYPSHADPLVKIIVLGWKQQFSGEFSVWLEDFKQSQGLSSEPSASSTLKLPELFSTPR